MREVQINRNLILREDGKLFNVKTGNEFIPKAHKNGYLQTSEFGKAKYVHQLVMEHFGPPKPGLDYEIDHINRNRLDNRLENLRWVTHKENCSNINKSLPIGKRACDYENITEYKKEYNIEHFKEWYNKNKEHMREYYREYKRKYRAKKKKEGN